MGSTFSIIKFSTRKPTTLSIFTNFLPVYSDKRNKQDHFNMRFSSVSVLAALAVSAQAQNLDALTSNLGDTINSITSDVGGALDTATSVVGGGFDTATSVIGGGLSTATSAVGGALSTAASLGGGAFSSGTSIAGGAFSSATSAAGGALSTASSALNSALSSIASEASVQVSSIESRFYRNRSRKEQSSQPSKQYQCRCRIEGQRSQCPYLKRRGRCYWNRIPYQLLHCRRCSDDCCSYLGCRYWCSFVSDLDGLHCIGVLAGELEHFIKRFLGHAF